ncbi:MAG: molybdopterin-synthase adenylyltransferase MoeB [Thermoplasmata archaeon]|nr:molybdopterin-synthase adenylyltransferase MoeB [Thermoplasmata archaeon]
MSIQVKLPGPLRPLAGGASVVAGAGTTVGEVLRSLVTVYPALERHLFLPGGKLRGSVAVYRNDEDIRGLEMERTPLHDGDTVSLVPSIAGGEPVTLDPTPTVPPTPPGASASTRSEPVLDADEMRRYSRHLLLPDVGVRGQKRLKAGRVLIVGSGGLGSPAALYLAAAGVGEIGLVDHDRIELSNLQRQILYSTSDVGRPKLEAASQRLQQLNPRVKVIQHASVLSSENALDIIRPYDVVVDGTDNFPTRYLVNDACVLLGKPNVYGSIHRFEGQASVFDASRGPCYRCLYPEPPPPDLVPSCAEGGVLGVLPGIIGMIQATEAVKILLGAGEPLVGRLLLYDALGMRFREFHLKKNPECVLCGEHPTQTGLIDYPAFCGVPAPSLAGSASPDLPSLTPEALHAELEGSDPPLLLDVREQQEWEIAHLPGAVLIPSRQLPDRVTELARARSVVVYCHSGNRSRRATRLLLDLGFTSVQNLEGGIDAWAQKVDPSMPRY